MSQALGNMKSMCIGLFDDAMLLTTEGLEWAFANSNLLLQMDSDGISTHMKCIQFNKSVHL